jgi:peroxiredoxin 2/4
MKKWVNVFAALLVVPFMVVAQQGNNFPNVPLIGEVAPSFQALTTKGELIFPNDYGKKWKILFSHPADFTPVCTSELLELSQSNDFFAEHKTKIAVISTDQLDRHKLWIESMEGLTYKGKSDFSFKFPLIADPKGEVSRMYGMIHPKSGTTKNVRGVFIIDPDNVIRSINFYPMEVGRNLKEIERTLLALQKHDEDKVLTPANWVSGEDVILPFMTYNPESASEKEKLKQEGVYTVSWYLYMKPDKSSD